MIDSSGLRLYYTDKLRQNEGAMLVTGVVISPFQVIPPGQKAYKTAGYCDFHCTHSVSKHILSNEEQLYLNKNFYWHKKNK